MQNYRQSFGDDLLSVTIAEFERLRKVGGYPDPEILSQLNEAVSFSSVAVLAFKVGFVWPNQSFITGNYTFADMIVSKFPYFIKWLNQNGKLYGDLQIISVEEEVKLYYVEQNKIIKHIKEFMKDFKPFTLHHNKPKISGDELLSFLLATEEYKIVYRAG
jgi:hypothetical protein